MNQNTRYSIDMCSDPLAPKLWQFALPLMFSGILQLLFNMADMVVVGHFVGSQALAAVGATGSLIFLLTSLFSGLSVGATVVVARCLGAGQEQSISATVHTAVTVSLVSGVVLTAVGILCAAPLLALMGTPADVLPDAAVYMRIYFIGMTSMMFYNFGASILRATGDTRRPLYYLLTAGIVNVLLNLLFVLAFGLGVAGVALATILSQCIAALLVLRALLTCGEPLRLVPARLRIHKKPLIEMLRIGLPAGLQGVLFSFSGVLIQSSINSFGSIAMAGSTAAANLEGFVTTAMNAFHQASVNFTSQNYGAKKYGNIKKVVRLSLLDVTLCGAVLGNSFFLLGRQLLTLYTNDPAVIEYGVMRMLYIMIPYFLLGVEDIFVGAMRGLGSATLPMIVSLVGICGFRIVWIATVFQVFHSLPVLYLSYPISWGITAIVQFLFYRRLLRVRMATAGT